MTPLSGPPVLDALPIQLRLVQRAATGTAVLGATFAAQPPAGMNGERGFQSGRFESSVGEEGAATITLPNAAGADGRLHRTRFACLVSDSYVVGDEWIEVWHGAAGRGRLLFVGTPADWRVNRTSITLTLTDGMGLLEMQRETAAGFWSHAPRDVFEHYTKGWLPVVSDDFAGGIDSTRWQQPVAGGLSASLSATTYWGGITPFVDRAWRLEMVYDRTLAGTGTVALSMDSGGVLGARIYLSVRFDKTVRIWMGDNNATQEDVVVAATLELVKKGATMAIELRDRFIMFYVDGKLAYSLEESATAAGVVYRPSVFWPGTGDASATGTVIDVKNILLRRCDSYLMRDVNNRGDLRLPGTRPSGGLRAAYFDDADLRSQPTTAALLRRALSPTRPAYAKRTDAQVNFAVASPAAWQAVGPPNGEYFSVRWSGAIYLDLAVADQFLRLANIDQAARLWVGYTTIDRVACGSWTSGTAPFTVTSGSMRTHTGGSLSGWYPLRLEYVNVAGGAGLSLQGSTTLGGTYTAVPAASLSPYGIYESDVRYDSHAEQLKALATTFGLQYRCEPRSLESGLFPGEVVPRIRVGRDTDKVLTPSEATEVELSGSARDTVQTLLADAAGLADPTSAAQLTSEAINFATVRPAAVADRHMMVMSGYESLSDITDPALLTTRLAAMLGLRLSPWEEIAARPRGARELRDTFPLTGAMAMFAWEPGDGVRIVDDQLGFADTNPRQIIAPAWPFVPDGLGAPSVRFRQRPRSQQDALRELVRAVLLPQRNYQGQLAVITGTWSPNDNGVNSRVTLPYDVADVIRAEIVVGNKSNTTSWRVDLLSPVVTGITTFSTVGRFDITPYVRARIDGAGGGGRAMIVQAVGGTGTQEFALELLVRV
jgi:hypothetical protein